MTRRILIMLALLVAAVVVSLVLAVPTASQPPVSPPTDLVTITPEIIPMPTLKKPTLGDDPAPWVWSEEEEPETPDRGVSRVIIKAVEFNPFGLRGQ
jgi:hypothetical protein